MKRSIFFKSSYILALSIFLLSPTLQAKVVVVEENIPRIHEEVVIEHGRIKSHIHDLKDQKIALEIQADQYDKDAGLYLSSDPVKAKLLADQAIKCRSAAEGLGLEINELEARRVELEMHLD